MFSRVAEINKRMKAEHACVIYWCSDGEGDHRTNRFSEPAQRVVGNFEYSASPSESMMLYPTWENFERASA